MGSTALEYQQAMIGMEEWQRPSISVVPVANPAAGAGVTFSPPGSEVTVVRCVTAKLVTSSASASRIPTLTFKSQGGVTFATFATPFTFAASKTTVVTWGVGLNDSGVNDGPFVSVPIPEFRLEVGCTVTVSANAIDTADAFSLVVFSVEQWPVRAPIGN